uniref:Ribosomal protein s4 n=1 Tax=Prototheca stagnorum TaxID=215448 RepID=A0A2Z6BEL4_9CHLO|nr:ribosomal protein s4 [Prototheca stagnorum]BBD20171.1 ribosomal protein s4 [Prototheca stagnorum]
MNSLRHFYYLYKYNMDKIQKNQNYKNGKNTLEYIKFLKLVNLLDGNITYTSLDKYSRFYYYFREKQRAKYHYRLKDYQLCTFSRKCCKTKKVKSFALDKLLNSRLDVVLFYLGISPTMKAARQLINHRHISINGKTINKPSYICKENDRILYKMDKEKNNEEIIFSYSDIKRLTSNKILNINTTALVDYYIKKL